MEDTDHTRGPVKMLLRWLAIPAWILLALTPSGPLSAGDPAPGTRFQVGTEDLPPPFATPSVANPPRQVPAPANATLRAAEGFAVNLFADGLDNPRWMTVAPNGDVFVAESLAGRISLLRDADGDGRAESVWTFAEGFSFPHGLALHRGWLYVADARRVWRLPYDPGLMRGSGRRQPVTAKGALGDSSGHWTRNIVFHPDGTKFYVAIGSRTNIAEEPPPHATVQEFSADGSGQRSFATGLRNPVGIAFHPGTEDLYVVVNERDGLGDGLVPDYLTRLTRGGFYGWPYAYLGPNPQPGFAHLRPDLVAKTITPELLFLSHSAPLGLVFYDGDQFPPEYRGDAFVALHGSWNAAKPLGYIVVRVPFAKGRPKGDYEVFVSGFWIRGEKTAEVWGRPAGLAVARDGSLLVADDIGNKLWRISYEP